MKGTGDGQSGTSGLKLMEAHAVVSLCLLIQVCNQHTRATCWLGLCHTQQLRTLSLRAHAPQEG